MTSITNIQIRLETQLADVTFATSWYGPGDTRWSPVVQRCTRPLDQVEEKLLSEKARKKFQERIDRICAALTSV